jgi:hypothetical protein
MTRWHELCLLAYSTNNNVVSECLFGRDVFRCLFGRVGRLGFAFQIASTARPPKFRAIACRQAWSANFVES